MKTIISIVGARPNFMKVAPLHKAFQQYSDSVRHLIVHTGQHYDDAMSKVFFDDLELPHPDFYLGVGSGTHAEQTSKVMLGVERVLTEQKPDLVIVVGDVNSTVAASLVSVKMGIPVAHVEAGLRSFDRTMPEEINRMLTDVVSEFLFVSEPSGLHNLRREGVAENKIFYVGNVMIDSLVHYRQKAARLSTLDQFKVKQKQFTLVTLHRPSNVDTEEGLGKIVSFFEQLASRTSIVFPVHPRTRKMLERFGLGGHAGRIPNLVITDPLGYLDFLCLMDQAQLVVTDSGGIQEETTYLGVPCLTLRENTERPSTTEVGTNELCGLDVTKIVQKSLDVFDGRPKKGRIPELWDGHAAQRIAEIILKKI
ncbi:MAG: UDP-N-acetylglucosamine 2-epimerase (non-hydrolyzing) [Ignavibacteriales bacterium]|nr:UDP-N-acetylglucosamine 2-epimerase (non-hydrolyzing) [Ignavibacteriales bacterium]